ncbi:nickel pincer cofactor biosynthesis protein LarC [Desulfofundulus salinus]|nr:nickel pincer cofactor biosynthesis protein LarC [Desulfofundulus salinum]
MMKVAYFDCFSGISGDMCLGALIGAGVDFEQLVGELKKLPVEGYRLRLEKVKRNGISAINFFVDVDAHGQPDRHLKDIEEIISQSSLPEEVKEKSKAVFHCLARAEAGVHDTTPERIHFHEVGAVDAIIDVVGTVLGLHLLGVEKVIVSPLPMGRGLIRCMHGLIPSPAPATLEILSERKVPVYGTGVNGELVTPTGAALAATLGDAFGEMPPMTVTRAGYGAGKKTFKHPNLLRVIIGEAQDNCKNTINLALPGGQLHGPPNHHGHN